MSARKARAPRSTAWWVAVSVGAGLAAVMLLQLAVTVFVGLLRLVLILVAVTVLWVLVTRASSRVRRR